MLTIVAAALATPRAGPARFAGCCSPACSRWRGFLVANPYALLDFDAFRDGLSHQSEASGDGGGKLGLSTDSGIVYYLGTPTWGLGWLPALVAARRARSGWRCATGAWRSCSSRRRSLFLVFMGTQDRFFARWLLPVYPLLCLLAAWAVVAAAPGCALAGCGRERGRSSPASARCCARRGSCSRSTTTSCWPAPDTRQLARDWMVANVPIRSKVVIEPFVPAAWAADAQSAREGTGNGFRWNKWPTTSRFRRRGGGVVRFEDYERTLRPALLGAYARGGYCWVVTRLDAVRPRATPSRAQVPQRASRYYAALERDAKLVYAVSP